MKSLKLALATQKNSSNNNPQSKSKKSLLQGVNRSNQIVNWMIDIDNKEKISIESLNDDELMRLIYQKLQEAFSIDSSNLSETLFERIIVECAQQTTQIRNELTFLQLVQDKVINLQELANNQFKKYLGKFISRVQQKITFLQIKTKKSEINKFDNILKGNFQKKKQKNPYLSIQQQQIPLKIKQKKSFSKSPNRDKTSSVQKFKGLLAQQKGGLNIKESLIHKKSQEENNNTAYIEADKSVSFSSVLSTTMAVKSRRRRNSKTYQKQMPKKSQSNAQNGKQEQADQAFIFFRPKKNKK